MTDETHSSKTTSTTTTTNDGSGKTSDKSDYIKNTLNELIDNRGWKWVVNVGSAGLIYIVLCMISGTDYDAVPLWFGDRFDKWLATVQVESIERRKQEWEEKNAFTVYLMDENRRLKAEAFPPPPCDEASCPAPSRDYLEKRIVLLEHMLRVRPPPEPTEQAKPKP